MMKEALRQELVDHLDICVTRDAAKILVATSMAVSLVQNGVPIYRKYRSMRSRQAVDAAIADAILVGGGVGDACRGPKRRYAGSRQIALA